MKSHSKHLTTVFVCALSVFSSFHVAAHSEKIILKWNVAVLDAISLTKTGPTVAARALNITSTCAYDAWAAFDRRAMATQSGDYLRQPRHKRTPANKAEAISYASYRAAVDLFPAQKNSFDSLMVALGYDPANVSRDISTPAGVGNVACAAVLRYRHADGANQLGDLNPGAYSDYTGYQPRNTPYEILDPNHWQPLRIELASGGTGTQQCLTPHWGKVKPFAYRSPRNLKIKEPAVAGTKEYREQVREVIQYSASLNDYQKVIAEYWADGPLSVTPPGHWNLFAQYVSRRDHLSLDEDVKLFFTLNNAMLDSSIWAWKMKAKFDYIRPVSAVHYLFGDDIIHAWAGPGMGTAPIWGHEWRPYQPATVVTPPFAEYVSGHSTFSAAGATVLQSFTGSDVFGHAAIVPAGSSLVEPGMVPTNDVTLSWATFSDAATEAAMSRRYGGIHFKDGDLQARKFGVEIATVVIEESLDFINGKYGRKY